MYNPFMEPTVIASVVALLVLVVIVILWLSLRRLRSVPSMLLLCTGIAFFATACGGDDESEFLQSRGLSKEMQGSGQTANRSDAEMTVVGGIKQWDGPPLGLSGGLLIDYMDEYRATVEMETVGGQPANGKKIVMDLWFSVFIRYQKGNVTRSVNNFVFLAREGFFDGHTFTVGPGKLVRTGDPPGPITGAGYEFDDEPTRNITHDRPGIVSMWNEGIRANAKGTNSSQWFISLSPIPEFDFYDEDLNLRDCRQSGASCHTPFGLVIEGMGTVREIVDGDRIKAVVIERLPRGGSQGFRDSAIYPRDPPAE